MGEIVRYTGPQDVVLGSYDEFKKTLDTVVEEVEEGFVQIGYLLKLARDTEILKESGYETVNAFAEAEYGLDKSAVSRFIAINDRFSVDGNSPRLMEQYRGIGRAKLSVMLLLPAGINEEISPAYSKSDIQDIKKDVEEEQKISELEVMMEGRNEIQEKLENNLMRALNQIWHDIPAMYVRLWKAYMEAENTGELAARVMDVMAPAGEGMVSTRLQGVGRMFLSLKGADKELVLVHVRSEEKENYSWQQMEAACSLMMGGDSAEESWEYVYGETFPGSAENGKVAPVQPKERKQARVLKADGSDQKKQEVSETEQMAEEPVAAGVTESAEALPEEQCVPEEIGPEYPPKGEPRGDGAAWKEPQEKPQKEWKLPDADAEYVLPVGKTLIRDMDGGQRYLILKMQNPYRVGNVLHLMEHTEGEATGEARRLKITHMTDDHGGITPGYCVIQFEALPQEEDDNLPGQMSIEDMEGEKG